MNISHLKEKTFYYLLGILPLILITTKVKFALFGMLLYIIIILTTTFTLKLIPLINNRFYEVSVLFTSVFYMTLFKIILTAIGFEIVKELGVYYYLIGLNAYIIFVYERFSKKDYKNMKFHIKRLFKYSVFIIPLAFIRELLGYGKIDFIYRIGEYKIGGVIQIGNIFNLFKNNENLNYKGIPIFIIPAGAFIILGFATALYQYIQIKKNKKIDNN